MAVIVGDKKYPTPIFSDKMSYIVLNPNWNIPESITKRDSSKTSKRSKLFRYKRHRNLSRLG